MNDLSEDRAVITLADALMRLAGSSLDEGLEKDGNDLGDDSYMFNVGVAMGVLSHLMHGVILQNDSGTFKIIYENGFQKGLFAAQNISAVFYDE